MKFAILILIVMGQFCFLSCKAKKDIQQTTQTETTPKQESKEQYPQAKLVDNYDIPALKDFIKIEKAEIKGNFLHLDIVYNQLCDLNEIELLGEKVISKSLPPIRNISLSVGKICKNVKEQKAHLVFSITSLAYQSKTNSTITLNLNLYPTQLSYHYE